VTNNLIFDSISTLVAVHAITSSDSVAAESFIEALGWKQWVGVGLFIAGMLIEIVAEESRKHFKANPSNKGKIDDTGLWSIVRHPNYVGYTLWRSSIMLAAVGNYVA
jgi:steroid 5-alpha reductase family enzyme